MSKREYLVQSPRLSGPCTVRKLKQEHHVLRVRAAPVCPCCGNDDSYKLSWEEEQGYCRCCGHRSPSPAILQ